MQKRSYQQNWVEMLADLNSKELSDTIIHSKIIINITHLVKKIDHYLTEV